MKNRRVFLGAFRIPLGQRKWKDLVTLETFHAFCGGPEPTVEARWLDAYACRCKFSFFYLLP